MGIYACPVCGNPNGWWSGNMRDIHDCPGPPRRQWPQRPEYPPQLDWSEADGNEPAAPNEGTLTAGKQGGDGVKGTADALLAHMKKLPLAPGVEHADAELQPWPAGVALPQKDQP